MAMARFLVTDEDGEDGWTCEVDAYDAAEAAEAAAAEAWIDWAWESGRGFELLVRQLADATSAPLRFSVEVDFDPVFHASPTDEPKEGE